MDNYYYLDANYQRHGPVAADKLLSLGVDANTLVWKQGLASWTKAGEVAELEELFMTPPAPQVQTQPESVVKPEPVVQAQTIQQPQQPAYQQPALSSEPVSAAPGYGNDSAVPTTNKNSVRTKPAVDRKVMLYNAGGVLTAALLAVGAFLLFGNSSLKVTDYEVREIGPGKYTFYANPTDEAIPTEITAYGLSATILDQHDYDDDGNIEALVLVNEGGNSHEPYPFVLYYDEESKRFRLTEEFEMNDGVVEQVNGRWTFIQRAGLRQTTYVFEDHQVKVAEETGYSVGVAEMIFMVPVIFRGNEQGERMLSYDLDDDGRNERLTVHRGMSHAEGYGCYMSVEEIEWQDGKTLKGIATRNGNSERNYNIYGAQIAFLLSKTNGMHDILTDGMHYHRWNGSTYREWIWNGTQLVCTNTSEGQYEAMATWDGEYHFTGAINGQWHFDMSLTVEGERVWGSYLVHEGANEYVALNGTIDTNGTIRIDEHYRDGGLTGYYFQGTFSSENISGKYLSTQRAIDMDFYAH